MKLYISKAHFKLLPDIALALSFELHYKIDHFKIWSTICSEILNNLYHYSALEFAKIRYATAGTLPKSGTPKMHKAMIDILKNELHLCTIDELLHLYHAFRLLSKDKIYTRIMNEIINRKKEINNPD